MKTNMRSCIIFMGKRGLFRLLTTVFFFLCVSLCRGQLDQLEKISRLSGAEYLAERERFLASQQKPIVLPPEAKPSWGAELLTVIINLRIEHKEKFAKWDNIRPRESMIRGYHFPHPLINSSELRTDVAAQFFVIEQIWKGHWLPLNKEEAILELLTGRILGPLATWRKVWENADRPELRAFALNILSSDPSNWNLLHDVLKNEKFSQLEKEAVFHSLANLENPRVHEFVTQSVDQWKSNLRLASLAMLALVLQTDEASRRVLYEFMTNKTMPMSVRVAAFGWMPRNRQPSDIEYIEKLAVEAEKNEFPIEEVIKMFKAYRLKDTKRIIENIFRTSKNEQFIIEMLIELKSWFEKEDEYLLDILQSRKDVSDEVLRWVTRVRETILREP